MNIHYKGNCGIPTCLCRNYEHTSWGWRCKFCGQFLQAGVFGADHLVVFVKHFIGPNICFYKESDESRESRRKKRLGVM